MIYKRHKYAYNDCGGAIYEFLKMYSSSLLETSATSVRTFMIMKTGGDEVKLLIKKSGRVVESVGGGKHSLLL